LSEFKTLDDVGVPVIMSIFAKNNEELLEVALKAEKLNPAMLEVDISCPVFEYEEKPWDNPDLAGIACEVEEKLKRVIDSV